MPMPAKAVLAGLAVAAALAAPGAVEAADLTEIRFACNEFPPQKMAASQDGLPGFDVEFLR